MNKYAKKLNKLVLALRSTLRPVALPEQPVRREYGAHSGTPVDRHYIAQFLADHSSYIKGSTLEVANDKYSRKYGSAVSEYLVLGYDSGEEADYQEEADILGDLTKPQSLPAELADCFICTQTLTMVTDPGAAIASAYQLLKPGGCLLLTVAGPCVQLSRYDADRWGDYWRFSAKGLEALLHPVFGAAQVEIIAYGNFYGSIAMQSGLVCEELDPGKLKAPDGDYPVIVAAKAIKHGI